MQQIQALDFSGAFVFRLLFQSPPTVLRRSPKARGCFAVVFVSRLEIPTVTRRQSRQYAAHGNSLRSRQLRQIGGGQKIAVGFGAVVGRGDSLEAFRSRWSASRGAVAAF